MTYNHETGVYTVSPEDRARALYYYFGWQGGTIHQLAHETGLAVNTILYGPLTEVGGGFSAIRTCTKDWRVKHLAPLYKGSWDFWSGAIVGFWVSGALDQ